ncbi:hypothetical protein GCM10009713_05750 [Brevibacterium celere]
MDFLLGKPTGAATYDTTVILVTGTVSSPDEVARPAAPTPRIRSDAVNPHRRPEFPPTH